MYRNNLKVKLYCKKLTKVRLYSINKIKIKHIFKGAVSSSEASSKLLKGHGIEVFELNDINELPIAYNIAWYEQKAVIVLLALLSLGVKDDGCNPIEDVCF